MDGKYADAVLGELTPGKARVLVAVEGKGPKDPLDRPFAGRKMSSVDQGNRYAQRPLQPAFVDPNPAARQFIAITVFGQVRPAPAHPRDVHEPGCESSRIASFFGATSR